MTNEDSEIIVYALHVAENAGAISHDEMDQAFLALDEAKETEWMYKQLCK